MTDIFKIYAADVMRYANNQDLILRNLRLVLMMAKKMKGRGLGVEDLIQSGNIALVEAARTFDPNGSVQFSTYACHAIRRRMISAMQLLPGSIHIPANADKNLKFIVNPAVRHNNVVSLYAPAPNEPRGTNAAMLLAPEPAESVLVDALATAIRTLSPSEQFVIAQRYGLTGEAQALHKVGEMMIPRTPRARVKVIENAAIAKLRNYFERKAV